MNVIMMDKLPSIHLVYLENVSIYQQLLWEEALLRCDTRCWCLINQGSPAAIVMGISSKLDQMVCLKRLKDKPIPVIRRFSGGGTVLIDPKTIFSTFICNANVLPVAPYPVSIMKWTEEFYRPVFSSDHFQMRENDYVLGNRKFGGNAQSITKGRWLHHSSLLWDYNPQMMDYLTLPSKRPTYRQDRDHSYFLCKLSDHFNHPEQFKNKIIEALSSHFAVIHSNTQELEQIAQLPHRKATQWILRDDSSADLAY